MTFDFYNVSASLSLVLGVLVGVAYIPTFRRRPRPVAMRLVWGGTFIIFGSVMRSNYWANVRYLTGENWPAFRDAIGGLNVNVASDAFLIAGFYLFLSAKLHAIPERDRGKHNIISAIRYPYPCRFPSVLRRRD
ncbi:hypothetical protein [uncultured Sulfitobacter sp.]|uniref:hypothetical protein n=1 Tax=uncultured Sulfitobacter sp. TaxID=191468 RepID=UPI00260CDED9|nr:hypothetical protein [uncultured Sulfitobacter sp.]